MPMTWQEQSKVKLAIPITPTTATLFKFLNEQFPPLKIIFEYNFFLISIGHS